MLQKLEELRAQVLPEQWCMLTVRSGKEANARDAFRRYGVRAYWPHHQGFYKWSSARSSRIDYRSIIPGYIFVPSPLTQTAWDIIERTEGVNLAMLSYSGAPLLLRNADIEVIREIERSMNTPVPGKSLHNFKTGDKVRFIDDTLNRWPPGRVASSTGDGRISVEVELMQRLVPFQVYPHQIERA